MNYRSALTPNAIWEAKEMTDEEKNARYDKYLRIAREHDERSKDKTLTNEQRSASNAVHAAAMMAADEWKRRFIKGD